MTVPNVNGNHLFKLGSIEPSKTESTQKDGLINQALNLLKNNAATEKEDALSSINIGDAGFDIKDLPNLPKNGEVLPMPLPASPSGPVEVLPMPLHPKGELPLDPNDVKPMPKPTLPNAGEIGLAPSDKSPSGPDNIEKLPISPGDVKIIKPTPLPFNPNDKNTAQVKYL